MQFVWYTVSMSGRKFFHKTLYDLNAVIDNINLNSQLSTLNS